MHATEIVVIHGMQVLSSMEPDLAKEKLTEIPSWMTARFLKDKYGALARAKGICIQEWAFFGKDMVENLYGSQFFKDGYDSWTEKVLKDERV